MVEPLEEVAPGEETLVETAHDFGIRGLHRQDIAVIDGQYLNNSHKPTIIETNLVGNSPDATGELAVG